MAVHNVMINEFSLRAHPDGCQLLLHLPWYRSLWLSACDDINVSIDGVAVDRNDLRFELLDQRYQIGELKQLWNTLWFLSDVARLIIRRDKPVEMCENYTVDLHARFTLPYMQIKPETYVPHVINMSLQLDVIGDDEPTSRPAKVEARVVQGVPPSADEPFKLGISLFSATEEITAGFYDLESLLERVAAVGVGPGVEIVASQTLRSYPVVTDEFERRWRKAFDRFGFEPSSYGANLDMGRMRVRDMSEDEELDFTEHMLQGAKKLGFPMVRIQSAKQQLLERLLPLAERLDLRLGYEIHAPYGPNSENILKVRETFDKLNSPRLGFVADFSSTMHSMSPALLGLMSRLGLDGEGTDELQRIWAEKRPGQERQSDFIKYLKHRDIDPGQFASFAFLAFAMHGHVPIEQWRDIMPQIIHVHAKFYDIDENGEEPAIDYRSLVHEFIRGGFKGYMSSEWEGQAFVDVGKEDPIALVKRQHNLIRLSMQDMAAAH